MASPRILIIAEIGSVHDGKFDAALELATLAKDCGADAVKFQTHIAEAETLPDAPSPPYFSAEPRMEYFKRTGFSEEQWKTLKKHCDTIGMEFMSSPFSEEAVDLLERVGMKRYKIPSGEVTNIPMLEKIAKLNKPVLLSSGMSSWEELDAAVAVFAHNKVTILQCTSEYPCPPENAGLNILTEMQSRYKLPVGLSDHTMGMGIPVAAAALGATVIEKHLTSSRKLYGSDAKHSMEPDEFTMMVKAIREVEASLNHPINKENADAYSDMKKIFQKSVVTLGPIKKGATITRAMLGIKKPGTGIPAANIDSVIGKKAAKDLPANALLRKQDIEG